MTVDMAEAAHHAPDSPLEYLPVAHSSGTWVSTMIPRAGRVGHTFWLGIDNLPMKRGARGTKK